MNKAMDTAKLEKMKADLAWAKERYGLDGTVGLTVAALDELISEVERLEAELQEWKDERNEY